MNTPDDLLRDALGTISGQCRKMFDTAMAMDTEQLRAENEALQRAIGVLGIIETHIMKGEATA